MASENVKSRRERRKEARLEKKQSKHQSWIGNQKYRNQKKKTENTKIKTLNKSNNLSSNKPENFSSLLLQGGSESDFDSERDGIIEEKNEAKIEFNKGSKVRGVSKSSKTKTKTKFEDFLEMTRPAAALSADEDLELERRLAKKLKVKDGKLPGLDDDLNDLIEGIPSVRGNLADNEGLDNEESCAYSFEAGIMSRRLKKDDVADKEPEKMGDGFDAGLSQHGDMSVVEVGVEESPVENVMKRKRKRRKSKKKGLDGELEIGRDIKVANTVESPVLDVDVAEAPAKAHALEEKPKYVAPHLRVRSGNESEEYVQIRRRVRGLLNRLSESNVESITGEISTIFRSISRSVASQIISEEIISSCSGGPRGNEQYAAVFAAFVAGMACLVGIDFSAKLLASLAKSFEDEYNKEDNLSLRNLTLLLSHLCIFGVCSSDLIYDFLIMLSKRLTEVDVSTILTVLQCCGMKIRGDDPACMKNFILSVQNRVNELKSAHGGGEEKINGKRMEFMLETICDIKNNKKRPKEDSAQHTRIKKWLQKLRVEDILIRGLKWSKLVDPNKKGQWWLSGDMVHTAYNVEEVANSIDKEVTEAQKMLQLASSQRMNTDARKAIFCIIMSGEDYIDAFEKLLRLDLPGKQDREIMRVLVECCLQEKVFNKYYTILASKLCEHDKNHKFTLQFCLWDHFKELESMELMRLMHLAKFVAEMVASFSLSIAVLKTIDFTNPMQLTPKKIMHFRMLFEAIFEYSDKVVWNIFSRVAVAPDLESLRNGIEFFVKEYVAKSNKGVSNRFKIAKKALNNVEGVLM